MKKVGDKIVYERAKTEVKPRDNGIVIPKDTLILSDKKPGKKPNFIICSQCGRQNKAYDTTCSNCGSKL